MKEGDYHLLHQVQWEILHGWFVYLFYSFLFPFSFFFSFSFPDCISFSTICELNFYSSRYGGNNPIPRGVIEKNGEFIVEIHLNIIHLFSEEEEV